MKTDNNEDDDVFDVHYYYKHFIFQFFEIEVNVKKT